MNVYVLDSNIMTFVLKFPQKYPHLLQRIARTPYQQLWVSVISVDEAIRGAYRLRDNPPREKKGNTPGNAANCYKLLSWIVREYGKYQILSYDEEAMGIFERFSPEVRRTSGKEDRQIAASAIRNGFTVITQNIQDFEIIPDCRYEDWTRIE